MEEGRKEGGGGGIKNVILKGAINERSVPSSSENFNPHSQLFIRLRRAVDKYRQTFRAHPPATPTSPLTPFPPSPSIAVHTENFTFLRESQKLLS